MKYYKFLKTISWLLKATAIITLVAGLIYSASIVSDMFPFFTSLFYTIVYFLVLMGFGGIIEIAVDIAMNINQKATNISNPNQRDEALVQWLRANPDRGINDYYAGKA